MERYYSTLDTHHAKLSSRNRTKSPFQCLGPGENEITVKIAKVFQPKSKNKPRVLICVGKILVEHPHSERYV